MRLSYLPILSILLAVLVLRHNMRCSVRIGLWRRNVSHSGMARRNDASIVRVALAFDTTAYSLICGERMVDLKKQYRDASRT